MDHRTRLVGLKYSGPGLRKIWIKARADDLSWHASLSPLSTLNRPLTTIVWLRHDLHTRDNPALTAAAARGRALLVFILDDVTPGYGRLAACIIAR